MEVLLQQIINGLVLGSMYALIALGYTMVYGIIQLINFAHGEVLMVGALTAWSVIGMMQAAMPGAPGWVILILAMLIACVVAAALNFVIEKVAYRPLRNSPRLLQRNVQVMLNRHAQRHRLVHLHLDLAAHLRLNGQLFGQADLHVLLMQHHAGRQVLPRPPGRRQRHGAHQQQQCGRRQDQVFPGHRVAIDRQHRAITRRRIGT